VLLTAQPMELPVEKSLLTIKLKERAGRTRSLFSMYQERLDKNV
jgi:hypothetical protein